MVVGGRHNTRIHVEGLILVLGGLRTTDIELSLWGLSAFALGSGRTDARISRCFEKLGTQLTG